MTVGERVRERRKSLGLTQEELGKKLGWGKSAVCRVEKEGNNITTDRITKIADALSCSPGFLMGWTSNPAQVSIYDAVPGSEYPTDDNGYPIVRAAAPSDSPQLQKYEVSAEKYELMQKYDSMSDELKGVVTNIIENAYQETQRKKQEENRQIMKTLGFEKF